MNKLENEYVSLKKKSDMKKSMFALLFVSIFLFVNLYSKSVNRVVFVRYENGKIGSYDTLWFSDNAKKTQFYYYDLDQMQRYKILGNDTFMASRKKVQGDLKNHYSKFKTQLLNDKPDAKMGAELKKAKIKVVGVNPQNTREFTVYYAPMKIHKNFYFDDVFKDIPGLVVYWGIDEKNYTQILEMIEVDQTVMNIPKFDKK
jgi:PhoPQ-activated pathogenicity-related protein